ncbi:MAG: NAD(P)-binding protein [Clostridiales Family XIII bacterium]|jgi:Fe-S oxidoreductase/ferredoxin|nr:NAD(P)-binding protein [Clostridiales Family XIII bacterium]
MRQVADFTEQFERCLMNEPAFCTAACPFGLDVRKFVELIKQDQLSAAYKQYRDAVVFPDVVPTLCDRPCESVCPLGGVDRPIGLQGIERFVTENAGGQAPAVYNLPARGKRVAVIGAGLSGLACALKLAQRKYEVAIFEAAPESRAAALPGVARQFGFEKGVLADILKTGRAISCRDEILALGVDAVYVATGEGGADFGLPIRNAAPDRLPALISPGFVSPGSNQRGGLHDLAAKAGVAWIAGGALTGSKDAHAIADGILAAAAIDGYLRTAVLRGERPSRKTAMRLAPIHLERGTQGDGPVGSQATQQTQGDGPFGSQATQKDRPPEFPEFQAEAARCLMCRCDACMAYCDLPAYANKWPPRIRDEVFATTLPGKAEVKATPAKRLINTDNLSGVFADVCPVHIDMDGLLLAGRQSMHRQGKMPWAFHEFWLRDMAHANGGRAALAVDTRVDTRQAESAPTPRPLAFFPGCQIGAGAPGLVLAAWQELNALAAEKRISLSGLILRCCGAPAEWAGDEALFREAAEALRGDWEALGRPTLVCACPSCMRVIATRLPEIETVSLYEILPAERHETKGDGSSVLLRKTDEPSPFVSPQAREWAVFDPCAAARLPGEGKSASLRQSVLDHARGLGLKTAPLQVQSQIARCCGYGGQPEGADPGFVRAVRENRAAESDLPYLCYCMNCREAFLKAGKPSAHILELRYADDGRSGGQEANPLSFAAARFAAIPPAPPELSPSRRRENRERLHEALAGRTELRGTVLLGRERPKRTVPLSSGFELGFADGVLARMDEDRILMQDIRAVLDSIRKTGKRVYNPVTGARSGSLMIGRTTYWVCYREDTRAVPLPPLLTVTSAYAHRLAIEHEEVWAGIRQDRPTPSGETK